VLIKNCLPMIADYLEQDMDHNTYITGTKIVLYSYSRSRGKITCIPNDSVNAKPGKTFIILLQHY